MPATDAPDFQRVAITVPSTGAVTDAPDFQRIVVGGGGTPIVSGGVGASFLQPFINGGFLGVAMHPYFATGGASLLGGTSYIMPFACALTSPVHNVILPVKSGAVMTAGTTFAGIYDWGETTAGSMTLLASSASGVAAAAWANAGVVPVAMTTNPTLTAGKTYAVLIQCNGNGPGCEGITLGTVETGPPATYPMGLNVGAGGTSLPAAITFASATIALRLPNVFVN